MPDAPEPSRWPTRILFVVSAAGAAVALHLTWQAPIVGVGILLVIGGIVVTRHLARRRIARLLRSGNVEDVLARWSPSLQKVPHPETMGPLMTATAFAAYGWIEQAREALSRAERGPAWEAAIEHRLFVDTLLLIFEGQRDEAAERAAQLASLPTPPAAPFLIDRVHTLRSALGALARAFSHRPESGDRKLLLQASRTSPLVYWAMRYGAAIVSVDGGQLREARKLVADAPEWPSESCFHTFHREIVAEVERREGQSPGSPPGLEERS